MGYPMSSILIKDKILKAKSSKSILGMTKVRTTPYHPQCDGRLNRTLIDILAKYCSSSPADWDSWLQIAVGAYRTAKQSSTGFSPAELLYGRPLRLPLDLQMDSSLETPKDPASYMEQLLARQRAAKEMVQSQLTAAQESQARNYDSNGKYPPSLARRIRFTCQTQSVRRGSLANYGIYT